MFLTINGTESDRADLYISETKLPYSDKLYILGSFISDCGKLHVDLDLHLKHRFKNCIKFFNFIRANKHAPAALKLKVLSSCVTSTLLYNCETFGPKILKGLEQLYFKLIKAALNIRPNTPNLIALIESGFLPLKALIHKP